MSEKAKLVRKLKTQQEKAEVKKLAERAQRENNLYVCHRLPPFPLGSNTAHPIA